MKALDSNTIKRKWGGVKAFSVSLLCMVMIGILPIQAEANDTRNRVLNQTIDAYQSISYDAQLDPFDLLPSYSNTRYGESESFRNKLLFNLTIYKDGFTINNPVTLQDFFPGKGDEYFRPDSLSSTISESGLYGMEVTQDTVNVGGVEFTEALHFSGKCTSVGYYDWGNYRELCSLYPNKLCNIRFGQTYSSQYKSDGRLNYKFYGYYRPSLGRVIGYGVKVSSNTYVNAAYLGGFTLQFYTPADDPSITISNVTTNTATISWDTNNTNPEGTSYTLQYQQLKENGNPSNEADWGTQWNTIPIDGANTSTLKTTTQSIFSQDNTYRLRVQVNHIAGSQYNVYSDYIIFSTSADPAVRAAYEAAIAAQAAKKAAEDSVSYSLDAKQAAEANLLYSIAAKEAALDAKQAAINAENKSIDIYNLVAKTPPGLSRVYTENSATATMNQTSPPIRVDADGATHFQLSLDKVNWSAPVPVDSAGYININSGVNLIYTRAYNEQIPEELRGYGTGSIVIFKL